MSYNILTIPIFDKQLKRLVKRYPSLKKEIKELVDNLEEDPFQGAALGNNCYKIRLSIASKGRGKSSGGRLITHLQVKNKSVYLLTIYDKAEQTDISTSEMTLLLKQIL